MILLRKLLVRIRSEYDQDARRLFLILGLGVAAAMGITIIVDTVFTAEGIFNVLRSMLLVPTAILVFSLCYAGSLFLHLKRMETGDWLPYRARFSPAWRRRMAIVGGALLLVLTQVVTPGPGYTFASACVGAGVIALLAFVRTTKEEASRESLGIPDSRDVVYDSQRRRIERERAIKAEKRKTARKNKLTGGSAKTERASKK